MFILENFQKELLNLNLDTRIVVKVVDNIGSTNDHLLETYKELKAPYCLIARKQTHARGQYNRQWLNEKNKSLCFSLYLQICSQNLNAFSLVVGLSLVETLNELGLSKDIFKIKWPNDLYIHGKKAAGILVEVPTSISSLYDVVLGIGINWDYQPDIVDTNFISQYLLKNVTQERFLAKFVCILFKTIDIYTQSEFQKFYIPFKEVSYLDNRFIQLTQGNQLFKGQCIGISKEGALILKTDDDNILTFSSGTVVLI